MAHARALTSKIMISFPVDDALVPNRTGAHKSALDSNMRRALPRPLRHCSQCLIYLKYSRVMMMNAYASKNYVPGRVS
jgi:hypothetical protein